MPWGGVRGKQKGRDGKRGGKERIREGREGETRG